MFLFRAGHTQSKHSVGGRRFLVARTEVPDDVDEFPLPEEEAEGRVSTSLPVTPLVATPEREEESQRINIETPEDQESVDVSIVDLTETPRHTVRAARANSRPVEVDLTCELDDEVFVVLVKSRILSSINLPTQIIIKNKFLF